MTENKLVNDGLYEITWRLKDRVATVEEDPCF